MSIRISVRKIATILLVLTAAITHAQNPTEGQFKPTVESLQQYKCPEWFRDAKFGIYCHWNAQSASKSANSGWYARNMYLEGSGAYKDHLKNWGHPSEVGYKDVIKAWKADKFDAQQWVSLFKAAGAKYIVTVAVHHDNFDMWDSKYQPKWNSTHYGPKKDVCGEMKAATEKAGLRWGVTTHLERTYSWFQTNKGADKEGPKKGIPYDGRDLANQDLYLEVPDFSKLGTPDDQLRQPLYSPETWKKHWEARLFDLIDRYHPDLFYFDAACPFMDDKGQSGLDVIAHFYNDSAARNGGVNDAIMVIKKISRHGYYYPDISSVVMERGLSPDIQAVPKETEDSIGPWFYSVDSNSGKSSKELPQFYSGDATKYKSSKELLHKMIDVVSKNNNYMLNIPPRGDGSFDDAELKLLKDFGDWFAINGDAIYKTRPWHVCGEDGIRFTTNGRVLYVIAMKKPGEKFLVRSLKSWQQSDLVSVELLGEGKLSWKTTPEGLEISVPKAKEQLAYAFKLTCAKPVADMPFYDIYKPDAAKHAK